MESLGDLGLPMPESPSLLRSLSDVASHINASTDLDTTLRHLLEAVCRETPWASGGVANAVNDDLVRRDPVENQIGVGVHDNAAKVALADQWPAMGMGGDKVQPPSVAAA